MGLLSFLRRPAGETGRPDRDPGSVEELRLSARRRLLGAAVLVAIGVVGFPLLFDSAPRPVAVDVPIEIPGKERVAPLPPTKPSVSSGTVAALKPAPSAPETGAVSPRQTSAPAEPRPEPSVPPPIAPERPVEATQKAAVAAEKQQAAAEAARARAALDAKPAATSVAAVAKSSSAESRFVVQVGAYSDPTLAREARARVEKLGMTTYTQVVETAAGPRTRVRVGPFSGRGDADRAAAQIKKAGLPAAVLTL